MRFTTSWDDGYTLDAKLADLLDAYGCTGTFYVCPRRQHGKDMLSDDGIRSLSERHEIGAHTLRHSKLTEVSQTEARQEIEGSKEWVEQITGKQCTMFCYPYGFHNEEVQAMVKQAGFKGARTTKDLKFDIEDPFSMPTTVQVTPFPKRKVWSRWWHAIDRYGPLRVRRSRLQKMGITKEQTTSWLNLAKALLDLSTNSPATSPQLPTPTFHLWGHSHEIEKYNMWEEFEQFLAHVKESGVECITNQKVLETTSL